MLIKSVTVYSCQQPLKIPFTTASSGLVKNLVGIYVKLDTEEGVSGIGEVRGNCEYFTGDTPSSVISTISHVLAPRMLGLDAQNINEFHDAIESVIVGNNASKCVCDAAFYDLAAKISKVPVYDLLGGKLRDNMVSEENIPFMSSEEAELLAKQYLSNGSRFIKVRVGLTDFEYDIKRVSKVWNCICSLGLASNVVYSIDANMAWDLNEAIYKINKLSEYGVTVVEQPIHFNSLKRAAEIKKHCQVKVFGDEDAASLRDVVRLTESGVIDGIHIKLIKSGGIYNALRIMHYAEANSIDYMIGGMDEGMLAVAAAVQCAAVSKTELFELHGYHRIDMDPTFGLETQGSKLMVPHNNGLGVQVNESMLTKEYERRF